MAEPIAKIFVKQGDTKAFASFCPNGNGTLVTPTEDGRFSFDTAQVIADQTCKDEKGKSLFPYLRSLIVRKRDLEKSTHVACKNGEEISLYAEPSNAYNFFHEVGDDLRTTMSMADTACRIGELPSPSTPVEAKPARIPVQDELLFRG